MSVITFQCYSCNQMLKVGGDKGGKKTKCLRCGTLLTIPVSVPTAAAPKKPGPPPLPPANPGPAASPSEEEEPAPLEIVDEEPQELEELDEQLPRRRAPAEDPDDVPPPRPRRRDEEDDLDEEPQPRRRRDREEEDDLEDEPRSRRRRDEDDDEGRRVSRYAAWPRVRLGLLLVFVGACVLAGAAVLESIGYLLLTIPLVRMLISNYSPPFLYGGAPAYLILLRIASFVELGAGITALVGYVFLALGPNKRGTVGLAIAALGVAAVWLLLFCIFKLPYLFGVQVGGLGFGTWFGLLLTQLLFSAEFILVPLYLRSVALAFQARPRAKSCGMLVMLGGSYAVERLLTFILWYVSLPSGMREVPNGLIWMLLAMLWLGVFLFVPLMIWYSLLVWRTRKLID